MIRSGPITVKVFPMQKLIPPELKIDVSAKPLALSDTTLSRADGAVILLEKAARPDKAVDTLPQAALWRKLLHAQRRRGQEAPVLVTRLPNRRQTLVVVGFVVIVVLQSLLAPPYLSEDPRHQGLLLHAVYHRPNGWDHVPAGRKQPCGESCMWGDYHVRELALFVQKLEVFST